jgi:hypothetical protein
MAGQSHAQTGGGQGVAILVRTPMLPWLDPAGPGNLRLSPRGRGREAMTYGRVRSESRVRSAEDADVSHLAELVRGDLPGSAKAPSSALRAPSPQGEKGGGELRRVR